MEEEDRQETKKPSYVGGWLSDNLYLEVGTLEGVTEVRIRDKGMKVLVVLGEFDKFLKRVKNLEKLAQKANAGEESV